MPPEYVLKACDRFRGWLRWFIAVRPDIAPTSAALARELGITKPALHRLLATGSQRVPDLTTVLAAERVLEMNVYTLLHSDPPPPPHSSR